MLWEFTIYLLSFHVRRTSICSPAMALDSSSLLISISSLSWVSLGYLNRFLLSLFLPSGTGRFSTFFLLFNILFCNSLYFAPASLAVASSAYSIRLILSTVACLSYRPTPRFSLLPINQKSPSFLAFRHPHVAEFTLGHNSCFPRLQRSFMSVA